MFRNEVMAVRTGRFVDEVVHVALAIQGDVLRPTPRDSREAHRAEQRVQLRGIGMCKLDELETIRAHRVVGADGGRRGVVREGSHGKLLFA